MAKHRIAQLPEDLYSGVEFGPVPAELATTLNTSKKTFGPIAKLAPAEFGISLKINTRARRERI